MINKIIKYNSIGMLLLSIIPIFMFINNYYLKIEDHYFWFKNFFYVRLIILSPWSIIIYGFFTFFFLFVYLKLNIRKIFILILIMILVTTTSQCIKIIIKNITFESRPYIFWLQEHNFLKNKKLNKLSLNECRLLLNNELKNEQFISEILKNYWCYNNDYTFPSGHAMFITNWTLIMLSFVWQIKRFFFMILITVWSNVLIIFRIILGIHWPKDILIGIFIGWIFSILSCYLIKISYRNIY